RTQRLMPRISLGGGRSCMRSSNTYGARPLTIGAGRIGLRGNGPAIVPGSDRKLTFGGQDGGIIAAGALIVSDPVELEASPLADLAVSLYLPGEVLANFAITGRYARQTNYISPPGNFTDATVMPVGNRILHDIRGDSGQRRFDRDVLAQPGVTHVIVMLGTNDLRNRWAKPEEEVTGERMIAGLQQMALRAQSAGVKIIGATLTPFGN